MGLKDTAGLEPGGLRNLSSIEFTAIPDSAINRWTISEGSGTTVGDSIGNNDVSLSGPTWESVSDAQDGSELSFDGSDDSATGSTVSEVGVGNQFSVGLTVQVDSLTSDQTILTHVKSSSDRFTIGVDASASEIVAQAFDGAFTDPQTLGTDSETGRFRLLVTYDLVNDNIQIYKNANAAGASFGGEAGINSGETGLIWGDRGLGDANYGGDLDDVIFYNEILSNSDIQADYDLQPWS